MRFTILVFVFIFLASCQTDAEKIKGVWALHSIEKETEKGRWQPAEWMNNADGLLIYEENTMSIHFSPKDTLQESYWYAGSYSINSHSNFVLHNVRLHSDSSKINTVSKRYYQFNGDSLILFAPEHRFKLKWTRKS